MVDWDDQVPKTLDWICTRTLVADSGDTVIVRIARPQRRNAGEWSCRFDIAGTTDFAFGLDSVQALTLALQMVRRRLEESDHLLQWEGGEEGDHGFEMNVPRIFGLAKTQEVEQIVTEAIEEIARQAESRHRDRNP